MIFKYKTQILFGCVVKIISRDSLYSDDSASVGKEDFSWSKIVPL